MQRLPKIGPKIAGNTFFRVKILQKRLFWPQNVFSDPFYVINFQKRGLKLEEIRIIAYFCRAGVNQPQTIFTINKYG